MTFGDSLRKAMDSELIEPEKGTYQVKLDEATAWTTQDGREFAKVTLEITEGEHAGKRFEHWLRFNNEIAKQMSAESLASYGVRLTDIQGIEDLDDQLDAVVKLGTTATVGVSWKDNKYMNVKVHGSRTGVSTDIPTEEPWRASFAAAATTDDSDLPF